MGCAPSAANCSSSSSLTPPSGPTTSTTSSTPEKSTAWIPWVADSWRIKIFGAEEAGLASKKEPRSCGWRNSSVTSGSNTRRDCLAAERAAFSHFIRAFSSLPSHLAMLREAAHGMIRSAPAWEIRSTASSARSDFGMACTTVTRGTWRVTSSCSTTTTWPADQCPRMALPTPSVTTKGSPSRMRLTSVWRASAPVRANAEPAPQSCGNGWMKTGSVI